MTKDELLKELNEKFDYLSTQRKIARRNGDERMKNFYHGRAYQILSNMNCIDKLNLSEKQ